MSQIVSEKDQPQEPVFFTGQKMAEVMTDRSAAKKAEPVGDENATEKDAEATTTELEVAPVKITPKPAPVATEPQAETGEDEEQPADPYDGIVQKYGGDTKKMAKAIANLQKSYTQKSQTLKRLLGSQQQSQYQAPVAAAAAPERTAAAAVDDEIDVEYIQQIANDLATNPTEGLKKFLMESRKQGARAVQEYDTNRRKQEAEAQRATVETENLRVISNRAREILLERAHEMGEDDLIRKYSNTKYAISEDEYIDAYDQLATEVSYINENFAPRSGRITDKLFTAARFGIDPENFNNNNRLTQARHAVEPDSEDAEEEVIAPQRSMRQQKTRVVLNPKAGTNKASVKFDPKKFEGTRTEFQEKVWTMSDAELDALERQLVK